MIDVKLMKVLECCANDDCGNCPTQVKQCRQHAMLNALDLINRQKAEIERLKDYNIKLLAANVGLSFGSFDEIQRAKAEAIKEFADGSKKDIQNHSFEMFMNGMKGTPRTKEIAYETVWEYIDNLAKEMTGRN